MLSLLHILILVDGGAGIHVGAHDLVDGNISSGYNYITCSHYITASRSAYRPGTRYNRVLRYSQISVCCQGYAGTPPNCPRK